jgi:septum formation protein
MKAAGFNFSIRKPEVEESWPPEMPVEKVPAHLAKLKAQALSAHSKEAIILAADTVVLLDNSILGKPKDTKEATRMLLDLSGKTHRVVTGVCLLSQEKLVLFEDSTSVTFRQLSPNEIAHYIEHFQPFDKAGAYGIQEWLGMIAVEKIQGSYYNVMGLPIHKVYQALLDW